MLRTVLDAPRESKTGVGCGGLAGGGLAGTAAEGSVGAGGGALGERAGFAALRAEAGSHPFAGTHGAVEKPGDVEVRIELGEVETEAGWSDFDIAELRGGGVLQALGILRREKDAEAGGEVDDDLLGLAVVIGGDCGRSAGLHFLHPGSRFFVFLTSDSHVSPLTHEEDSIYLSAWVLRWPLPAQNASFEKFGSSARIGIHCVLGREKIADGRSVRSRRWLAAFFGWEVC